MNKITHGIQILFICLFATTLFAEEPSWEYKNWKVDSHDTFIRYTTNGDSVHGHEFGFAIKTEDCNQDLLWLTWSTYGDGIENNIENFEGTDATIQFIVGETRFQIRGSILSVYKYTPKMSVFGFSNFIADKEFISLLKKEHTVEISIIAPKELVAKLDITADTFSLNGFVATRLKAEEYCKEKYQSGKINSDEGIAQEEVAKLTRINQAVLNSSPINEPMIFDDGWKTLTENELAERIQRPVLNINTGEPFNFKVVDKNDKEVGRVNTPAEYYQQIRDGNALYISSTLCLIDAGLFESVAMPLFYFSRATQSKHSYVRDFPFDVHDPLTVLPVNFILWRGSDQRVVVEKASEKNKPWRDIAPNARILNATPSELKVYDTFFEDMYNLPNEERYNGNQASHILHPAVIGDLNNDGYEDIVLSCARYNVGYSGRSYYFKVLTRKSPNDILEDITDEVDELIWNPTSSESITNIEMQTETKGSKIQGIESEWAINEQPTTNRVDNFTNQRFEDYKAQIYRDKIHLPKWISNNGDGTWSDNLGKGVGEPKINFAGKYFLESHSCGTGCSYFTLTDLSTGLDLDLLSIFNNGEDTIINRNGIYRYKTNLSFRPDSYMLVARKCSYSSPYDENGEEEISCQETFYLLNDGKIELLDTSPENLSPGQVGIEPITGMEFVWVPKGCYQMGSTGNSKEQPDNEVCLNGFWMGKYEVTQGQWKKIMKGNPSTPKSGDKYPVTNVSWYDSQSFISELNRQSGNIFRLPLEAEWEYAARSGGKDQKYAGGNDRDSVSWYSCGKAQPVGTKAPNDLGLYDMSGNVSEWCEDLTDKNSRYMPVRGDSWLYFFLKLNEFVTDGRRSNANDKNGDIGFRLAITAFDKRNILQALPIKEVNKPPESTTKLNKSEWTINESEGKVNHLFSINNFQKDAFQKSDSPLWGMSAFLFPTEFGDNPRVCIGFRGFGGEGADLFTMKEIDQERNESEIRSVGMRPMKVNDVWIKFDILGILGETTDTVFLPQTQGDLNELVCVFANSTEVTFNGATYTTKGFIKTFKEYNKMLNYRASTILDYCKDKKK